jgi:L-alanine-DL-glutamate epimerase-like enolase superfamily enzyme
MPSVSQFQEWSIEDVAWPHGVYGPMPEVVDGHVQMTTAPGWGVEIDPGFLASATSRTSS